MAKFDNAETGNRVWDLIYGWGTITKKKKGRCTMTVIFDKNDKVVEYFLDGYLENEHVRRLFWNEVKLPTIEEDKCFNLVDYLKDKLIVKKFVYRDDNYYLAREWNPSGYSTTFSYENYNEIIGTIYFENTNINEVWKMLCVQKITYEQLQEAFKKIGWL